MKLVLLDRDGVINHESGDFVKTAADWQAIASSPRAIAQLNAARISVAVCTNQSGIGRGLFSERALREVHAGMASVLRADGAHLDAIYYCPHAPAADCDCRKPRPGLLLRAMREHGAAPADTCFVGDSLRDIDAALAAGCTPILVRTGNGAESEVAMRRRGVQAVFDDLAAAVPWILAR